MTLRLPSRPQYFEDFCAMCCRTSPTAMPRQPKNDRPLVGCTGTDEARRWQSRKQREGYTVTL
ncbi:MAG TPA: hypothetical protein EYN70_00875 [Planctomycetaceae bacterium]|nr:hypothetical protein [Planctomycetaceae bacterium]